MLYLDSSALIKHYIHEAGTKELEARLQAEEEASRWVFTSVLTYAEIYAALAREMRDKTLPKAEFARVAAKFDSDWVFGLSAVDLGPNIFGFLPELVRKFPLKGSDAVHLASALWIRDTGRLSKRLGPGANHIVFATSDKRLGEAAMQNDLEVFDPETSKQIPPR